MISAPEALQRLQAGNRRFVAGGQSRDMVTSQTRRNELAMGQLLEVGEQEITLEWTEGKGKKALQQQMQIQYENIKSTIVQVQF